MVHRNQWHSQNAKKDTHIEGRLLDQLVIIFNCAFFKMETYFKGKNLPPEGVNSFLYEQLIIV